MFRLLVVVLPLFGAVSSLASGTNQLFVRQTDPFAVTVSGKVLDYPFFGGLNSPKPTARDIDGDGLPDLLVGELSGKLSFLRNIGSRHEPVWTPTTQRLGGIDIGSWHLMEDINGDNLIDLLCDSRLGTIKYYQRVPGSIIRFTLIDSALANLQTGANNTPDFADIDADGDLDYFFGALNGNLEFHQNTGTAQNPIFTFVTDLYDSILAFPSGGTTLAEPMHGFSNISFADYDADGDLDLFWGDIFNFNMYLFKNQGTPHISDLTHITDKFLAQSTEGFNHPGLADIDGDGDFDMILGVANGAELNNLRLYRNIGTASTPNYLLETFNIIEEIDVGSAAKPALGDIDADGDLDLLVGAATGTIHFFRNTGSAVAPQFELETTSLGNIDVGNNAAPTLVDIDADGDLDLLIGNLSGKIEYWSNTGTAQTMLFTQVTNQLALIKVDQLAVPKVADLNGDNLKDLIVGEWDFNNLANVWVYQNTGTPTAPAFTGLKNPLLRRVTREYTIPTLYDWDGDDKLDVILGTRGNRLAWFKNTATNGTMPDSLSMIAQPDSLPGFDDGTELAVAIVDIDGDADIDLFIGEESGGLNFYASTTEGCCSGVTGNLDGDFNQAIDITDLQYLIDFLFFGAELGPCAEENNVDGDALGQIDITDFTELISYLFFGADLPQCP